ncbi:hypothetical protein [Novosphingobium sp.]|uniref:hypothetical protein n=1 Tax=Novosphingobium sp. TaxID=1874826 RepID=UPI00286D6B6E|nr:hypothetical protein [Novosphingobium sp.]
MADDLVERALARIAQCNEPKDLRQIAANAIKQGQHRVRHAAELRLYDILPAAKPGTLEYDVWRSIYALEGALKAERNKTTLLARTRQKIARDGEHKTVADLVSGKVSDGFRMLVDRNMPELTFEAVALRHAQDFDEDVVQGAEARLGAAGFKADQLLG